MAKEQTHDSKINSKKLHTKINTSFSDVDAISTSNYRQPMKTNNLIQAIAK